MNKILNGMTIEKNKINKKELNEILEKHRKWLNNEEGGEKADLSWTNMSGVNLVGINLSGVNLSLSDMSWADLSWADLSGTNLVGTDLSGANLGCTNLRGADLSLADLSWADLSGTDLSGTDLREANLECANLKNIKYDESTSFFALSCPEEGSFIGFKKCGDYIVKLLILEDAKRSSATSRKCRCDKAKVLSITKLDGSKSDITKIKSNYDENFVYEVGKTMCVEDFDEDRWNKCSTGIHFFITREEAVNYQ